MRYNSNDYNLIIEYDNQENDNGYEYITGFKYNSDIIYNEPDKITMGMNGLYIDNGKPSSIAFAINNNSSSIKLLNKLSTGEYLFIVKIVNRNNDSDVKVVRQTAKPVNTYDNTTWIIEDLYVI